MEHTAQTVRRSVAVRTVHTAMPSMGAVIAPPLLDLLERSVRQVSTRYTCNLDQDSAVPAIAWHAIDQISPIVPLVHLQVILKRIDSS